MIRTVPHDAEDPAEVAAIQTPDGEPDGELIDPETVHGHDSDDSEVVVPS
jgi:hypothetical protein